MAFWNRSSGCSERRDSKRRDLQFEANGGQRLRGYCPHPRAPGALALSLDRGCRFLCFPQRPRTPMLNFFARSGPKIEKIDSLWTGRGIGNGQENDWCGRSDSAVEDEERDHVGGFGIDREHAPAAFVAYRLMRETRPAKRLGHTLHVVGFEPQRGEPLARS